jgi:hypothetical protein
VHLKEYYSLRDFILLAKNYKTNQFLQCLSINMKKMNFILLLAFLLISYNSVAQQIGCTDPLAINFNPAAEHNDGSCIYEPVDIEPYSTIPLSDTLDETSGLIIWNNRLWTHNDDSDINLYALDTLTGAIQEVFKLSGVVNIDWEEIAHDENYIYMGDFGNNANGNRTDLKILRIEKKSLLNRKPLIDTIHFVYSNQNDFSPAGPNNTDFDCEAFIVTADSIYLFTKQWISNQTSMYALPKSPGSYTAQYRATLDVEGMITGVTYIEHLELIAFCGYNILLQPFIYLLYDFQGYDFFSGNKRKLFLSLPFHQIEAIASDNGIKYYLTNEYFSRSPFINVPQRLHVVDLSEFLGAYINRTSNEPDTGSMIFPNPATDFIRVVNLVSPSKYQLISMGGQIMGQGYLTGEQESIGVSGLPKGMYLLKLDDHKPYKFLKN